MGTVLVDRYRAWCESCGYDQEFVVGVNKGWMWAVEEGRRIHKKDREIVCATDEHLRVAIVQRSEEAEGTGQEQA